MRTIYIAYDGAQFDNEHECEIYEFKQGIKDNKLIMLDENKNVMESNESNLEKCCYIKISNKKDLEILHNMCDYNGCCCPYDIGEFYYDFEYDDWADLNMEIKNLEKNLTD